MKSKKRKSEESLSELITLITKTAMQSKLSSVSGNGILAKPSSVSNQFVRLPCRYSHQLAKKRKTWQDGRLHVTMVTGEIWSASLFDVNDCRGVPLEVRPLEPGEVKRLKSRQDKDIQIQMEKYIIDVCFGGSHENYEPPLKLAKFKPPSAIIIPQVRSNIQPESEVEVQSSNGSANFNHRNSYNVTDSELDEIWGPKPAGVEPPTTFVAAPQQSRPRAVPQRLQEMLTMQLSSSRPLNSEPENSAADRLSRSLYSATSQSYNDNSGRNNQRTTGHQQPKVLSAVVNGTSNGNSAVRGSMLRVSSSIWD